MEQTIQLPGRHERVIIRFLFGALLLVVFVTSIAFTVLFSFWPVLYLMLQLCFLRISSFLMGRLHPLESKPPGSRKSWKSLPIAHRVAILSLLVSMAGVLVAAAGVVVDLVKS